MGNDPVEPAGWRKPRLTFRRLSGLDRSGPPPPQTLAGAPLNPWTIPNAIGFTRIALIPVFLAIALSSGDGVDGTAALIYAIIAWSDYADGMAARITGQYSRLGTLLDPLTDRLLVIAGVVVCWEFELLERWALAILVARELFMLVAVRYGMSRGIDLKVNWPGRLAVWPLMSAIFFALVGVEEISEPCLYAGLVLALVATAMYLRDGSRALNEASTRA